MKRSLRSVYSSAAYCGSPGGSNATSVSNSCVMPWSFCALTGTSAAKCCLVWITTRATPMRCDLASVARSKA